MLPQSGIRDLLNYNPQKRGMKMIRRYIAVAVGTCGLLALAGGAYAEERLEEIVPQYTL